MFARVMSMKVKPGQMTAALDLAEYVVVPTLETYPGFDHWYSFVDWDTEKVMSVAIWRNEVDMNRYSREVMPGVLAAMGQHVEVEDSVIQLFDVAISTESKIPQPLTEIF
ncbi:MAG: antibiotic biosynthesis monooxygenase [Ardenticatenaceae bacterium]|nr:antibiotic biosynthesis monooxygenase [Ardenticatenaceae bacterium]